MGASASTTAQTITNSMYQQSYESCPPISSSNTINIDGSTIVSPPGCPSVSITQSSKVDGTCLLGTLQTSAAQVASTLDATTQAGLGLSVSADVNTLKNNIAALSASNCSGESTANSVDITNSNIESCGFPIVQTSSASQRCQINTTQSFMDTLGQNTIESTSGSSFNFITIIVGIISIALILMAVIAGIVIILKKSKNSSESDDLNVDLGDLSNNPNELSNLSGGGSKGKYILIIVGLIILCILIFLFWKILKQNNTNKKILNDDDINRYNEIRNDAHKIAKINANTYSDTNSSDSYSKGDNADNIVIDTLQQKLRDSTSGYNF